MKYWINTISKDHVMRGVAGGFTQANHGKNTVLQRLTKGDRIIFYSPKTTYDGGEVLQAFSAVATVAEGESYQFEMLPNFLPWRRSLIFDSVSDVPIKPLINDLSFIANKTHWGYRFRFGLFEIPRSDFELIAAIMEKPHTKD